MFKYCAFSKFSLSNILNNEIYMNHHESFNDPFECRCEVLAGFPEKDPSSPRFQNIIRAWGFDDANDEVALESYDDYVFGLEGTEPDISHTIDSARICCFSKKGDNLLMWSHYADGLRGFCIEFNRDLVLSNHSNTAAIYEVLYENTPAVIDTAVIAVLNDQVDFHHDAIYEAETAIQYLKSDLESEVQMYKENLDTVYRKNNEIYQKMLATKPKEWSYEEEIRIISESTHEKNLDVFLSYPAEAIKSVIVGEKMPDRQVQVLRKLIEQHSSSIMFKRASRARGAFNIVIDDNI